MSEQDVPKIEFPCDYPIRVMGKAAPDYKDFVVEVVKKHDPHFSGHAEVKESRTGKFQSVVVVICATGEPQLKALHEELKASGRVHMVL